MRRLRNVSELSNFRNSGTNERFLSVSRQKSDIVVADLFSIRAHEGVGMGGR